MRQIDWILPRGRKLFTIEPGTRPQPNKTGFPFDELQGDLSFFVPATYRDTPKRTRASIYSAASFRGIRVTVCKAAKDGVAGFRVFLRAQSSPPVSGPTHAREAAE